MMRLAHRKQGWFFLQAAIKSTFAARRKWTTDNFTGVGWHSAGDGSHFLSARTRARNGIQQTFAVWMMGLLVHKIGRGNFSDRAGI